MAFDQNGFWIADDSPYAVSPTPGGSPITPHSDITGGVISADNSRSGAQPTVHLPRFNGFHPDPYIAQQLARMSPMQPLPALHQSAWYKGPANPVLYQAPGLLGQNTNTGLLGKGGK
jgi:hypothetical protein